MLRRRILESIFKFTSDPNSFNFAYGIQLDPEQTLEIGQYVGLHQVPVLIDGETYYKLAGTSNGNIAYVDVAIYNFTTTQSNQQVTFVFKSSSENPNDFIGATKLDSTNKNDLAVKLSGVNTVTHTYTVASAGSHFIKVYYYQHNDGQISGDNAGYFRMIPYNKINYSYRYKAPNVQNFSIKSYYGWNLTSKPEWINIGKEQNSNIIAITSDTSGTHNLKLEAYGNPGAARSGNLVLTEKYGSQSLTLPISQAANPHPNDIILTRQKLAVPNDYNPTENIGVELIGNTSYTISNVSSGLSITNQTNTNFTINTSGLGTPTNNTDYTFRITGNAGTVKDIIIYKEGTALNCYCDCNSFNGCGCHSQTTFVHKDKTGQSESCPKHDSSQGVACASHNSCWCDCNQHQPCLSECNNCTCNTQCEDCVKCEGKSCDCYSQCNNCGGHCLSKNCSCYGQCNNCAGDCNGKNCSCYGQCTSDCGSYNMVCSGDCSCHSNYTACDRDYDCYNCESQCAGKYGCECDYGYHGDGNYACSSVTQNGNTKYCSSNTNAKKKTNSIYSCFKTGVDVYASGCSGELRCSSKSPSSYCDRETVYLGWSKGDGCIAFYINGVSKSCSSVCETHNSSSGTCVVETSGCEINDASWDGCSNCDCWSFFARCKDYYTRCDSHNVCSGVGGACPGNYVCGGKCNSESTNSSCGGHCIGHNTTYNTSCGGHCDGHGTTYKTSCIVHCPSQYNSHRETCECNRNYNTECTSQNCSSKDDSCGCNQKTYYPYCSCDQYCKCDGYTVPTA